MRRDIVAFAVLVVSTGFLCAGLFQEDELGGYCSSGRVWFHGQVEDAEYAECGYLCYGGTVYWGVSAGSESVTSS